VCHGATLNEQAYNEVTLYTSDNIISFSYGHYSSAMGVPQTKNNTNTGVL